MAPLFRWRADKANDLQLESDPRVAGSVVIGSGTNANYCRGVFIFKNLDASQEATLHNSVKPFMNSRVVIFFVASSSDKKINYQMSAEKSDNLQHNMLGRWVDGTIISVTKHLILDFSFWLMQQKKHWFSCSNNFKNYFLILNIANSSLY